MSVLTADEKMVAIFSQLTEVTEICDDHGKVLGFFTPKKTAEEETLLYEKAKVLFDPEEMKRRIRESTGKGATLDEIWQRIHARAKS